MFLNIGLLASKRASPIGSVILTSSSGTWTCPAGVTSVSAVLVGTGGMSGYDSGYGAIGGGGGGALTYKNAIAVTPGTTYSYSINTVSTTMFGLVANAGSQGRPASSGNGGAASYVGSPTASYAGGKGADPGNGTHGGGAGRYDGTNPSGGVGLLGIVGGSQYGTYGEGRGTSSGPNVPGSPGGIRIIWGDGRSFPYNAL